MASFDQDRGAFNTEAEWRQNIKNELWKLYPDMGAGKGVTKAIMELIDADLTALRRGREDVVAYVSNGDFSDHKMIESLLVDLGVTASRNGEEP